MDGYDLWRGEVVAAPRGPVEISGARHADGSVSIVAWRPTDGRRLGHLHRPRHGAEHLMLHPDVAGSAVEPAMRHLLALVDTPAPAPATVAGRCRVEALQRAAPDQSPSPAA